MVDGDTSADNSVSGYLRAEQIVLTTSPTGAAYSWGIAKPSGATSRSDLNDATAAAPTFTPDIAGYYVITCTVDKTTSYVLRIAVLQSALTTPYEAIRLQPLGDSQVTAPAVGACLYYSATQSGLAIKLPDDSVLTVDVTPV
jgi:hypothetical protein